MEVWSLIPVLPQNPAHPLTELQLSFRSGDVDTDLGIGDVNTLIK